jgi:hypothetical protein
MTPDEEERIDREEEQKLEGWFRELPEEEALVWVEAEIEDCAKRSADFEQEAADKESLLNLATLHGTNPIAAIKAVQLKPIRTKFEMDALAAWEHLRQKSSTNI